MKNRCVSLVCLGFAFAALWPIAVRCAEAISPAKTVANSSLPAVDAAGNTPLHLAALRGNAEAVDALLAKGADANALNAAGATPLHYGAGSARIVAALLAHGAKPDVVSAIGITPLLGAVARPESFGVVSQLIAAGANINAQRRIPVGPTGGANALALAIVGGDPRTIALLLERKAELNPKQGTPPLTAAALVGDVEVARQLLAAGANVNAIGGMQGNALNAAFFTGHLTFARFLIEQGADLRAKSILGYATPPMIWSAYNDAGDPTIARLLVERGVDINSTNDAGETALSYALKVGTDTELVRYLRSAGAKVSELPLRDKKIPSHEIPVDPAARATLIRDHAQRALDLLQLNSTAFLENGFVRHQAKCVSCHQQSLPAMAAGLARERGLRVDERALGFQLTAQLTQSTVAAENAREMDEPLPGAGVTLGYEADGLQALRYAPDEITAAMSHYLLGTQRRDGSWPFDVRRPPMGDGAIVSTAWSARALQLYPPPDNPSEVKDALLRTRAWLSDQQAATHNHRVFQLLGLAWTGETVKNMEPFASALLKTQRPDGGWAQLPGLASDAWATGTALVALNKAGIKPAHAPYRRGVDFLLRTQFDDGSWWVRSRTWPFQPHFDGKFPHGKDQWISAASTAWATMALLLTIDPTVAPEKLPNGQQLIAAFAQATERKENSAARAGDPAATMVAIDFSRDIQPLFERSCVGCHGGARPRGGFALASRDSLFKGGQSGDPAIVPGHADDSPLIRYVSGAIEDLEMPPLARREKYPALSAEEIARLRQWIDTGAPWPAGETKK